MRTKNFIIIVVIAALTVTGGVYWLGGSGASTVNAALRPPITVHKTPTCGCCGNYVAYLKGQDFEVTVHEMSQSDLDALKDEYGVPHDMMSCHTSIAGNYAIEGHVPVEAMEKMFMESPEIRGIALPGMPSGSPGMPGVKAPFSINQMHMDGSYSTFISM